MMMNTMPTSNVASGCYGMPSSYPTNIPSWPMTTPTPMWPSMWTNNWMNPMTNPTMPSPMWNNMLGNVNSTPFNWMNNNWMNSTWADASVSSSWMKHILPREVRDVSFRPMSVIEYETLSNPIRIHPIDGSRSLYLCFDVKGFKPEEVTVSICNKDRSITVEAKHEIKEKEHAVTRTYSRKFCLPEYLCVDLSKCELKSCVTSDGLCVIEGLLPRLTPEELKTLKEKCPSSKGIESTGSFAGGLACSIPIKTIA